MELPDNIKNLYKHWLKHTLISSISEHAYINNDYFNNIVTFANERMDIWQKKTLGQIPPYTQDTILQKFRFCNIYRELDRQTIEIHTLLKDMENDFDLWLLNLAFNRFLCKPDTFNKVGSLNFNEVHNEKVMKRLLDLPSPKYGSAYVFPISVIQKSKFDTREKFFCQYLPIVIPKIALLIKSFDDLSVKDALTKVLPIFGFNFNFHWTEILIDVAYQFPQYINLFKAFPVGPGSKPTIEKIFKIITKNNNIQVQSLEDTLIALSLIKLPDFNYLTYENQNIYLSCENWEGIGCEFRKYSNLKEGRGRRRLWKAPVKT